MSGWRVAGAAALLWSCWLPLWAHNGAAGVALPLRGIRIDGDLSDWPDRLPRYPISLAEYGTSPRNEKDFQGFFRVGYDPDAAQLYVAVEVRDDSVVADFRPARNWDTEDGMELYVDLEHGNRSLAMQYVVRGQGRSAQAMKEGPSRAVVRFRRTPHLHQYEWAISLADLPAGALRRPLTISLDVVACDYDADRSFSWMAWGPGNQKGREPARRGDIVLVPNPSILGRVEGQVRWTDSQAGLAGKIVQLVSVDNPRLEVRQRTAPDGSFSLDLPEGRYRAELEFGAVKQPSRFLDVRRGHAATVEFTVAPGSGRTVKAGPGREIEGSGFRQGPWFMVGAQDGLGSGNVGALCQDHRGYLWIGTGDGLSRYDGHRFRHLRSQDGLIGDDVRALLEDKAGNLWIGTSRGLSRYDGTSFRNFTTEDGLVDNEVLALYEDREGKLWIATAGGLSRYDGGGFSNFTTYQGLSRNRVTALAEDRRGVLWVAASGLCRFDGGSKFVRAADAVLDQAEVRSLKYGAADSSLWIGTDRGLVRYDGEHFTLHSSNPLFPDVRLVLCDRSQRLWAANAEPGMVPTYALNRLENGSWSSFPDLGQEEIRALLEDREGNVWVGTANKLARHDAGEFDRYTARDGLISDFVRCFREDRAGNIWIGTENGLSRYDGRRFTNFAQIGGKALGRVSRITEDRRGAIWFTTDGNGLYRYENGEFRNFGAAQGLYDDRIGPVLEDAEGNLWLGTNSNGLIRYDGREFTAITSAQGLPSDAVGDIRLHGSGGLWMCNWESGVSLFEGGTVRRILSSANGLPNNRCVRLLPDRRSRLWVGMEEGGVCRYDGRAVACFTVKDGLAHDNVKELDEDARGILWVATAGGLSQYDGFAFQNLLRRDGLPDETVEDVLHDRHGQIWIGLHGRGVLRYRPQVAPPPIAITDVVTDRRLGAVPSIRIPNTESLVAFEYQGISFRTSPEAMLYRYRLRGYEENWRTTGARRVEYQNLPRGNYTFEVQAIDRDLSYSETPARVAVQIHWPWAKSALWGGLALLAMLGALLVFEILRHTREAKRARQVAEAASRSKSEFLANMSHEIRTPMNGIIGMTHLALLQETNPLQREHLSVIQSSARSLLNLLNDILDFSKIEASKMRLEVAPFRVQDPVREACQTLMAAAKGKEIGLDWNVAPGVPERVEGDANRVLQVLLNLIGNSIKFTQEGSVGVEVTCGEWSGGKLELCFAVRDTGIGIPKDQQAAIFDAFRQAEGPMSRKAGGTGLGLTISARLAALMGGRIEVESEPNQGSTFRFYIQAGRVDQSQASPMPAMMPAGAGAAARALTILLAEDNPVNQRVAQAILSKRGHRVTVVGDGRAACEAASAAPFDLILMDVQMPEMDGWEATRWIRRSERESGRHVRIVAMTAHAMQEARQACLDAGMDDVVLKPFEPESLFAVVEAEA